MYFLSFVLYDNIYGYSLIFAKKGLRMMIYIIW